MENQEQLEQLREAYRVSPDSLDAAIRLAQRYSDVGWFNEAIEIYKEVLRKSPDDYAVLLEYGNVCFKRKEFTDSIAVFKKLTELKPERIEGWNNLGIVQLAVDERDAARNSFARVLEIEPDNSGALLNMGNYYQSKGETGKAIVLFEHAVASRADFPDGWFNLGNAYLQSKEYAKAQNAYEKALRYQREFPSALKNLGFIYEQDGNYEKAEECYSQAANFNKADAALQVNLANVYLRNRRYEEARKCFLKAVRLAPRETSGWLGLRHLALLKGDIHSYVRATLVILPRIGEDAIAKSIEILRELDHVQEAAEIITQTDRLDRTNDELDAQRLVIYQKLNMQPGKATAIYKRLSALSKPSVSIRKCLGIYAHANGLYEAAIRILSGIEDLHISSLSILWQAQIARGERKEAEKSIRAFIEKNPDCFDAWFQLARIGAAEGNKKEAMQSLKKAIENGFTGFDEVKKDPTLSLIYKSLTRTSA